ncbi:MAG: hypothetical protein JNM78_16190 [Cyclobacteriaceae bacterium]|nr:hypothetical protein [Cyclobacteriaceae bacterium]
MKIHTSTNLAFITMIFSALLFLQSCSSKGGDPSPADQMKAILIAGSWNLQTVSVDGVDKTAVYTGLTIKFTDGNFTTTNGRVVWPASGTWQFANDSGKIITRGDGLSITIEEATASKLILKFNWSQNTLGPGRTTSVKGENVFTFGK